MVNLTNGVVVLSLLLCLTLATEADAQRQAGKPDPTQANVSYGPHERNVLDFWKAQSDKPTPLLVFFHGGGFRGGDKASLPAELLNRCLEKGISVATCNYRLSNVAPFPAPMLDGARAVQFLRSKAAEWGIDPTKVACSGGSAGAGISLWIAFHDDLAKPESQDPVERQSTRISCAATMNGQCSYDPRWIKEKIGGSGKLHSVLYAFYGITPEEENSEKAYKLYEEAAAITYLSAGDPPVFMFYQQPDTTVPLPADAPEGVVIHHPQFGYELQKAMQPLGIKCIVRRAQEYNVPANEVGVRYAGEMVDFFVECFGM